MINELLSGVPLTMYMCDSRTLDETHTVSLGGIVIYAYICLHIYNISKAGFLYVCMLVLYGNLCVKIRRVC